MKSLLLSVFAILTFMSCSSSKHSDADLEAKLNWELDTNIKTPESVYFEPTCNCLFISNIAGSGTDKDKKGWISKVAMDGKVIKSKWVKNLNAPKGMRSHNGSLWVTDINTVYEINLKASKIKNKYIIDRAKFLNDVAIDSKNNTVYVSDTIGDTVYTIKNGDVAIFLTSPNLSPNGLLVEGDKLTIAAWGMRKGETWETTEGGNLYQVDIKTKNTTSTFIEKLGNLDGLEILNSEEYIVSDWSAGNVYILGKNGSRKKILKGFKGAADLGWDPSTRTLILPRMQEDKVSSYSL